MPSTFSLGSFLEDHDGFVNQHGVAFFLMDEITIHVACPYPGLRAQAGQALEVVCLYPDEKACMNAINAYSKIELNQVVPLALLQAYEEGRMALSCLVTRGRLAGALLFTKRGGVIRAVDEDSGASYRVNSDMCVGGDYIAFTLAYFHLE